MTTFLIVAVAFAAGWAGHALGWPRLVAFLKSKWAALP
jgi:hypothetical protein